MPLRDTEIGRPTIPPKETGATHPKGLTAAGKV